MNFMEPADQKLPPCNILFVTEENILEDSVEACGQRELFRALGSLGMPCQVICRFHVAGEEQTEPGPWLAERGWDVEGPASPSIPEEERAILRVTAHGMAVTLLRGASTKAHAPDDVERTAFVHLVESALDLRHADIVVVRSGACLSSVLAAAHARNIAAVALQPDCTPRDPALFADADVVLTPTRFAAEYLREAFGLPCANLPPVVCREPIPTEISGSAAVVFDGSAPGNGLSVFVQLAQELGRQRPSIPLVVLGGTGAVSLPGGGQIQCVPHHDWRQVWRSARVFLAPLPSWEVLPLTALSALAHGVPVIASDRGSGPELMDGAALVLTLPGRTTSVRTAPLQPAELSPWVETILRLYDDSAFAAGQRSLALLAGPRWSVEKLAEPYARFFAGVVHRRRRQQAHRNGLAVARNGSAKAARRLSAAHPWPNERPDDAAPGQEQGWLGAGTDLLLSRVLSPDSHLVVELGAWLGMSTRFIANHAPRATIVSVDHWEGSPEHKNQERFQKLLPRLYETYLARCWDYRERIVPLRMSTEDGLRTVAEAGLQPDFVYVDAEHSFEAVTAELSLARQLFPRAVLGGDDYDWRGVRQAVDLFARRNGLVVDRFGARGWRLLDGWDAGDAHYPPLGRGQCVVLVPHMTGIEWECEQALRQLEGAGVRVVRRGGCSAIDVARNEMISDALHDDAESILFIDSDVGFEPQDALRLLARPEPVIAGIYAKKGVRELASAFADGVKEILFGPEANGLYPLKYAATGFLRIRAGVLRRMIAELRLPLCNTLWGRGVWPFFLPLIVPQGEGKMHYLGEDWAFSHRLGQIGVTPMADTSVRLWHWGRYGFGWEDAGSTVNRYRSYSYRFEHV
jgi:hypothetical protein